MDVAGWLQSIGLGEYEAVFRDNKIDSEVLSELTDADLEKLGVPLGHRKRLLRAVAVLCPPEPDSERAASAHQPRASPPLRTDAAERRQLTVLFCDLVGSTTLSARLDPEDLRDVMRKYQDACAGAIARFDGYVAKFMGDGVLAYFGYPRAHEDDAERAIRAAMGIVGAVRGLSLSPNVALRTRIGIATGVVVVGDSLGEGAAQEQSVTGETPNLAARLQELAEPDAVVIAESTRRLVGGSFELKDLGSRVLKGMVVPVPVWSVIGERLSPSRFEAAHGERLAVLVGRENEVALLLDRWQQAKSGEGQVVLLSGEAGIGKSRITETLRARIAAEPHTSIRYQCSPHGTDSPFYPVIAQLQHAAGFAADDQGATKLDKLEAVLRQSLPTIDHVAPLIAALLSLPAGEHYPAIDLTPQQQKEQTVQALTELLGGLARQKPVLFVLEDAHWIDPTTLELFNSSIAQFQAWPVLLIVTFRPEFRAPWSGHAHVTALTLNRLGRRHVGAIVAGLTGGKSLPEEVYRQILEKTDGVPLFIEELTKAVLESDMLLEEGDRYVLRGPLPPFAIPATLHDSLLARLDRLAPVKEIAQIGAAIGRDFSYRVLAVVASWPDAELQAALRQLVEAELLFGRGSPPDATYVFKHALVQDAAYGTLLRSRRQQLHAKIAKTLAEGFAEVATTQPELVAHHYAQAGLVDEAISYFLKAGRRSAARSANEEAIRHYTRAQKLLEAKPDDAARDRLELELQIALGVPTRAARGGGSAELEVIYGRARDLSEKLVDTPHRFTALHGLWNSAYYRKPLQQARDLSVELVALADAEGDNTRRALARRARGCSLYYLGEFASAWESFRQGIELWDVEKAREEILVYGEDPSVVCRFYGSWSLWALGHVEKSRILIGEALADAERLSSPFMFAWALSLAPVLHILRREFSLAVECANASSAISAEHGFPQWTAYAKFHRGRALVSLGRTEEGLADMEEGWTAWQTIGTKLGTTWSTTLLAEAYWQIGNVETGLEWIKLATEHARTFGEAPNETEIHRIYGELLLITSAANDAEVHLQRAIEIARAQKAKSFELRAAMVLARLWEGQGRRQDAYDLVAPVYGWFSEGFDTPDLKEAKALLETLA